MVVLVVTVNESPAHARDTLKKTTRLLKGTGLKEERRVKSYESCFKRGRVGSRKEEPYSKEEEFY